MIKGQIINSISGFYDVVTENGKYRTRARGNLRNKRQKPIVGDYVEIQPEEETKTGYLMSIDERKNSLKRPLLANISDVLLLISAREPEFSPKLLDRFLTFIEEHQVAIAIYISKMDLLSEEEASHLKRQLAYYESIGYPVFYSDQPLSVLEDYFKTKHLSVLAGQSGVGKSTLLNQLNPNAKQETAAISQTLNRGKHTTRQVQLFELASGYLADTPGFSSIDIQMIQLDELRDCFVEFRSHAHLCQFRSCQHLNEPNCEIKRLVESGDILQSRYDMYLELREEVERSRTPEYVKKQRKRRK
ncbi:ribosome small subunit-dependent GTPase A [Holzapfeliella sp. He02]|uniref:Small ribosomal subunit biogenesis GTPase RsgA n=1 Tax=Holzapfeliella saturejae TaxID=3082953 RepID=A0ABU8SI34_9LACO